MTYPEWLRQVHRLLAATRPDIESSALDPNASFAAWKGGLHPSAYARSAVPLRSAALSRAPASLGSSGYIPRNTLLTDDQAQLESRFQRFHFGAFALWWVWGPLHKKDVLFWALPLGFIPFVGWIASLGLGLWAGVNGYRWAWESGRFSSLYEFDETERAWNYWGAAWFAVTFMIGFAVGFSATYRY